MTSEHNHEARPENGHEQAFFLRKSAMDHASEHLRTAFEREADIFDSKIYVRHAPTDTPDDEAIAILLTRDGQTPLFEEDKERLYLYFPTTKESPSADPLMVWIEHISAKGRAHLFTLTLDAIQPTDMEIPTDETLGKRIQQGITQVARSERKKSRQELKRARRFRDLIQNFYLTPQG